MMAEHERQYNSDTLKQDTATLLAMISEEFYAAPPSYIVTMLGLLTSAVVIGSFPVTSMQRTIANGFMACFFQSIDEAEKKQRRQREQDEDDGA